MAVGTAIVAQQYFGVAAGVPIGVNMPAYSTAEYEVVYGRACLLAVLNVDYTITLAGDFNTFTLIPLAPLLVKINALIGIDVTDINQIVVRQILSTLTSTTSAAVRDNAFTSREFDRLWRAVQEVGDKVRRSLVYLDNVLVSAPILKTLVPGKALVTSLDGLYVEPGPDAADIAGAEAAGAAAVAAAAVAVPAAATATAAQAASAASAAAALASANAAIVAKIIWRGAWGTGVAYVLNDAVRGTTGSYVCIVAHTAGASFAVDLAAGKWSLMAQDGLSGAGTGDMLAATYDPTAKNADAFAMANMAEGATQKIMTAAERTKLAGIEALAEVTSASKVGTAIAAGGIKATPVDADVWAILDSAAGSALKYVSGSAIKAFLKTYFDGIYATLTGVSVDIVAVTPGADQNNYAPGLAATTSRLSILNLAPTACIKITGLNTTGWSAGKRVRLRNTLVATAAAARMIILERNSAASNAANRFSYGKGRRLAPVILMPGDNATFMFDGTNLKLESIQTNVPFGESDIISDNTDGDIAFTEVSGAGASSVGGTQLVDSATHRWSSVFLGTGTTTAGSAAVIRNNVGVVVGAGAILSLAAVVQDALATGAQDFFSWVGLDVAGTRGIKWLYKRSSNINWQLSCIVGGVETLVPTALVVTASQFMLLGFFVNGDGTRVDYFYSTDYGETWTIFATPITTNIPTGDANNMNVSAGITKFAGTASRVFYLVNQMLRKIT